ncbi:hypothetical protein BU23DRAFT_648454 [Bimuria novae-zelandiae CBS 107.79]|uniref:Rhodopsin domain-containing protein n=1 Tax=Bimuria novae-zelandiae CBS 107.79 TaxID=1447943 RepID=A0A6A5V2D6_9PLEO|nr:hypothetical protein BU23DRAFT_648454 [Bimuria novae-zelandiae CBS 107.79]
MATVHTYPKETLGPTVLGVTITVTTVALLTLIIRLYVRVKIIRSVGWDVTLIIREVHFGTGKHIDQIPPEGMKQAFKLNFVTQPLYLLSAMLVKESIGFFLLRIAITPFYRRTIISVMVFMALYTFASILPLLLQCTNLALLWDNTAKGTCWNPNILKATAYAFNTVNIITDLLFAVVIPVPMLWKVQMKRRKKCLIIGILGLGLFATAAAIVKFTYLTYLGKTGDWLWDVCNLLIWAIVETRTGIIAGNLSCLRPLFRSVLDWTYSRGSRNNTAPKYLTRPYGEDSRHKSDQHYTELGPIRTPEDTFRPYGAKEVRIMTRIGASNGQDASPSSIRDESLGKISGESTVRLQDQAEGLGVSGGITRTSEVNVFVSARAAESNEEITRPERKEAHIV